MRSFIIVLLCLFLLTGCGEEEIGFEYISQTIEEIEVYDEVYLYDIFDGSEVEITTDNIKINTDSVGTLTYQVKYTYNKKKYYTNLLVEIVDTEAPRYLGGTSKSVTIGYTGELCDLIMYGDNYDGYATCTIEGEYDVNTLGTYDITYILEDSSANITEVEATLKVINKSTSSSSTTSTKYQFSDIITEYKTDDTLIGIDVSKWQGDIDFESVKSAGASFVIIRIGVQSSVEGEITIDKYYEENIQKAKDAGLMVGVYLYSKATSKSEAIQQAEWVLDVLDGIDLELPVVFDWESWSNWNSYHLSFHEINSIANSFMEAIENSGYEAMLYSSKYYLENIWTNENNYAVWLAHYTSKTSYTGEYYIWQMCNTGRISGIDGDVDIDILYYS